MNFSFFMREVWRSLSRNAVPSFAAMASVLVTMLVLGAFIPVMQMANAAADQTRDKVFVSVFLKNDATKTDVARVGKTLEGAPNVKSVQFISKGQALKEQKKVDPEAFKVLGDSNPLPDAFRITPKDPDEIPAIMAALAPTNSAGAQAPIDPKIDEVKNARETPKLLGVMNAIRLGTGLLAFLLIGSSILLVGNTIRLSLFARRREVEVMKLVGATDWFIRWPFVLEGLIVGLLGGVMAILVLLVAKTALLGPLETVPVVNGLSTLSFALLAGVLMIASVAVSALGSGLSLRRFLKV
ncbi:MAG: permease-like cell division protein FtsX [Solirubrobacteraceae bacterium]|nr:permease-like cell division protein FtsX [Solirubrobacteraceae bacterium]